MEKMKIFEFLKRERINIENVDSKLSKFQTIFNGILVISRAGRKEFEIVSKNLRGITAVAKTIENDQILKKFSNDKNDLSRAENLTKFAENFEGLIDKINLKEINVICESIFMRRETIKANCSVMHERLEEDYHNFSDTKEKYFSIEKKLDRNFEEIGGLVVRSKSFYDLSTMLEYTRQFSGGVKDLTNMEKSLLDITNEVNSKIFAMITLFNNSIIDLKENTKKSKMVIVNLIKSSIDGTRKCCKNYENLLKENFNLEPNKPDIDQNWLELSLEKITNEEEQWKRMRLEESMRFLEKLKKGEKLDTKNLLALANTIEESISGFMDDIKITVEKIEKIVKSCSVIFNLFINFSDDFQSIKKDIGAMNDSDVYHKTLYENFNTKMTFILKNYLIVYEIMQKALKKKTNEQLGVIFEEYKGYVNTRLKKIRFLMGEIKGLKDNIVENVALLKKDESGQELSGYHISISGSLLKIDSAANEINSTVTTGFFDIYFHSYQSVIQTFLGLAKLFKELDEHCDIQESFLAVVDESENEMMETLNKDPLIKPLLTRKVEIDKDNQLVFRPEKDLSVYYKRNGEINAFWKSVFDPYLKSERQLRKLNKNIERQIESNQATAEEKNTGGGGIFGMFSSSKKKPGSGKREKQVIKKNNFDVNLPKELEVFLDLAPHDYFMASTNRYVCRVNKSKIPYTGDVFLLADFLIFYCVSYIGKINLLIPYLHIKDIRPSKNFFGKKNGIKIKLEGDKDDIEFFVENKKIRDEFSQKVTNFIELNNAALNSKITLVTNYRDFYIRVKPSKPSEEMQEGGEEVGMVAKRVEIPEKLRDDLERRVKKSQKRMKLGYFSNAPLFPEVKIPKTNLQKLIPVIFGSKPLEYKGSVVTSFMFNWRAKNGAQNIQMNNIIELPNSLPNRNIKQFYESDISAESVTFFKIQNGGEKVQSFKEKITIIWSHMDQVSILLSIYGRDKLECENLLILKQGKIFDEEKGIEELDISMRSWWRSGRIPHGILASLYGICLLQEIKIWALEMNKARGNNDSGQIKQIN